VQPEPVRQMNSLEKDAMEGRVKREAEGRTSRREQKKRAKARIDGGGWCTKV